MKNIHVSAAIIQKENKFLVTQRGYGEFKDYWEFPGGKIEPGETKEEALIREIREELKANIRIDSFLIQVDYTYPNFHLTMECFLCHLENEEVTLVEAENAKYVTLEEMDGIDFLPADVIAVEALRKKFLS